MSDSQQAALPFPDLPGIGEGWELLLPSEERTRRCTGSTAVKLEEQRQAIMRACVNLGTRRVAEAFGVSREVVRALRAEAIRSGKLDQLSEEFGRRALGAADRILDRIEDEVDQLPRASLALTYGILVDKGQLLAGRPTARVEHVASVDHADINALIESLPAAQPVVEGDARAHKAGDVVLEIGGGVADEVGLGDGVACRASDSPSPAFFPCSEEIDEERADDGRIDGQKGGAA